MCVGIAGGLHTGKQSDEDVVHGGIWQQIPKAITSQRLIHPFDKSSPSEGGLQWWSLRLLQLS